MDCPEENVIVDFVRGELTTERREEVEAHLDDCEACMLVVAEMAKIFRSQSGSELAATLTSGVEPEEPTPTSEKSNWRIAPPLKQGEKLGRYVVLDRVGAGGMGVVHAAYDPELDRKVALKLLLASIGGHRDDDQNEQRTRLMREAQAMAKLSHGNVIAVHDVGTVREQVFIAMEFLEGGTLSEWLKEERRSWRQVLKVFLAAGEGLAAAHAAGLVHRDFKPDNVLLGDVDGPDVRRVVVTDFGLARPARGRTDAYPAVNVIESTPVLSAHLTQTGELVGTPAYMSPEQLAGERSGRLGDQFSFCVALYEGLYGERPFPGKTLGELMTHVADGSVRPPPRDRSVPWRLRRVVLKGLATDPEERYPDMQALLRDLRRDPFRRWRRWGSLALPIGVLGVGVVAYLQDEDQAAAYCADVASQIEGTWGPARRRTARGAFLATAKEYAADSWDRTAARLDEWAGTWIELQTNACRAEADGTQPQAVVALRMACLERHRQELSVLVELLETADEGTVQRAVDAAARLPDPALCEDVDRLTDRLGALDHTEVVAERNRLAPAMARARVLRDAGKYERSSEEARSLLGRCREVGDRWMEAEVLVLLGQNADFGGRTSDAESLYHEALTAALAASHYEVVARSTIGLVWVTGTGRDDVAIFERWVRHGRAALKRIDDNPELSAQLANAAASAYLRHKRYNEAEEEIRLSISIREKAFGTDHPSVGAALSTMGELRAKRGDLEGSAEMFERARDMIVQEYGPQHPTVAAALDNMGIGFGRLGKYDQGLELLERGLRIRSAALGADHPHNATTHINLGMTMQHMHDLEGALQHYQAALEIAQSAYGPEHPAVADALGAVAYILGRMGRWESAADALSRAAAIRRATLGESHPKTLETQTDYGWTLVHAGRAPEAVELLESVRTQHERRDPPDREAQAILKAALADALLGNPDRAAEALPYAEQAVAAIPPDDPQVLASAQFVLARALARAGGPNERAHDLARSALEGFVEGGKQWDLNASAVREWLASPRGG